MIKNKSIFIKTTAIIALFMLMMVPASTSAGEDTYNVEVTLEYLALVDDGDLIGKGEIYYKVNGGDYISAGSHEDDRWYNCESTTFPDEHDNMDFCPGPFDYHTDITEEFTASGSNYEFKIQYYDRDGDDYVKLAEISVTLSGSGNYGGSGWPEANYNGMHFEDHSFDSEISVVQTFSRTVLNYNGDDQFNSVKFSLEVTEIDDPPDTPSQPSGPTSVTEDETNSWSFKGTDVDSSSLLLRIDWGDGTTSDIVVTSGVWTSESHTYSDPGTYNIRVKASDDSGNSWSSWSSNLSVTVESSGGGGGPTCGPTFCIE